ncbi:MAG: ribonuclease J [Candidatus Andersenbacteria bacterium]|nr:ribonuclease J [Candidatus Andersenbacteria bacterium]MBI3251242.1 ribonuclease J [Candidatus Andersenbacteria bacterium]
MNSPNTPTPPPVRPRTTGTRKPEPVSTSRPRTVKSSTPAPHKSTSRPPRGRSSRPPGGGRGGRRPHGGRGRSSGIHFGPTHRDLPMVKQPPRNPDGMYLIPMGGLEEIGRNCAAVEYKGDIVVIDIGLMFPSENMYGIDYIIPDISPLAGKEKNVKGVIITHAHYDHFGGVPHILPKLGNPPVFGSEFTMKLVEKRHADFPQYAKPKVNIVKPKEIFKLGKFEIETFHVNHSVPNSFGVVVRSPAGSIAFTGDFKFDLNPVNDLPADEEHLKRLGEKGITVLYTDSTGAEREGHSMSEKVVEHNLEKIFEEHPTQRIITATFSSMIDRLQQLVSVAERYGRKVAIDGYSMKTNVAIAKEIGFMDFRPETVISAEESTKLPPGKVLILCTGAQGEDNAVLMRIVTKEHRSIELQYGDVVVFSSSVIPGNEASVQLVKDAIYKQGAEVIHYKMMDIHSGGHGHRGDMLQMIQLTKPVFLIPAHGYFSFRAEHCKMAVANGFPRSNCLLPANGEVVEIVDGKARLTGEKYELRHIMVDGLGVGDIGNVVLRDRQMLASDGMVVVIATVDGRTGRLVGEPDLISRGFVYMKEHQQLIRETRQKIVEVITKHMGKQQGHPDWSHLKNSVRDDIGQFLFQRTERRPMVLPVIVEV